MKKILFIAVYNNDMKDIYEEIGIASIASFLRQNNYEVKLMGAKEEKVDYQEIVHYNPEIIGLPMYTVSKDSVYRVARRFKELIPNVQIVVGGCLPTYYSSEILLEANFIDYAMRGEGEITWLNLLQTMECDGDISKVKGLTYRNNGEIVLNEEQELVNDLDIFPAPARDIIKQNKLKIAQISSSRGCKGRCSFCMSHEFWKEWRGREIKGVVDEIENLVKNYNVSTFDFIDGSMEDPDPGLNRLVCFANEIISRNLDISFYADCRAEFYKKASGDIMKLLKKAGLCGVCIGIETGNEQDIRLYKKRATIKDNHEVVKFFRKYDIFVDPGFINFNPYSTIEGLRANINYLEEFGFASRVDHVMSRYRMFKDTYLTEMIKKDNLLMDGRFDDELRYHYVYRNIEGMSNFMQEYISSLTQEQKQAFYGFNYYGTKFNIVLIYYRRIFNLNTLQEAYEITQYAEVKNKEICSKVNTMISQWFKELINIAEVCWNDEEAKKITDDFFFEKNNIVSIYKDMVHNRNDFYFKVLALGKEYEKYIVDLALN